MLVCFVIWLLHILKIEELESTYKHWVLTIVQVLQLKSKKFKSVLSNYLLFEPKAAHNPEMKSMYEYYAIIVII